MAQVPGPTIDPIASALDIVGVEGPGEGLHAALDPERKLLIGRGLKGLEVPDPHVSLQHAEIEWNGNHYVLVDLDSITGTELEGEKLLANQPQKLVIGHRFKVGSTVFEVVERHKEWRRLTEIAVLAAMLLVLIGGGIWVVAPKRDTEVALLWGDPIRQGASVDAELAIDPDYLRRRGIDPLTIRIRRVTDFDADGVDEVWFTTTSSQYVISFEDDGRWRHLGEVSTTCADVRNSAPGALPQLDCGHVTWAAWNGAYEPIAQKGVVLWGVPKEAWTRPVPPPPELAQSRWATLRRESALAGFLASNGVGEPIHYLICEHVFEGVPALALTQRGDLKLLGIGCRDAVQSSGGGLGRVSAVAFTAAGHRALLDDLNIHLGGSRDGLFRPAATDPVIDAWKAEPVDSAAHLVQFTGPDSFLQPLAAEGPVETISAWPSEHRQARATTAVVTGTGTVNLDPPGCSLLEVSTEAWHCQFTMGCMASSTFLTVREIGCGDPRPVLSAPYSGGQTSAVVDGLEIGVRVETAGAADRLDVVRTRVGWRPAADG